MKTHVVLVILLFLSFYSLGQDLISDASMPNSLSMYDDEYFSSEGPSEEACSYFVLIPDDGIIGTRARFDLDFSPPPVKNSLMVKQSSFEVLTVSLYNLNGALLQSLQVDHGTHAFALEEFTSGSYKLRISNGKETQTFRLSKINPRVSQ